MPHEGLEESGRGWRGVENILDWMMEGWSGKKA